MLEGVRSPEARKGPLTTPSRVGRTMRLKSFQPCAVSQAAGRRFLRPPSPSLAVNGAGCSAMECLSRDSPGWLSVSGSQDRSLIPHNCCDRYRHNERNRLHSPCHWHLRHNRYSRNVGVSLYLAITCGRIIPAAKISLVRLCAKKRLRRC